MIEDFINKIIQGDCLEVMKEIPDKSVDLVITSPPYNVGIEYDEWNDNLLWDDYYAWCEKWLKEILRILKDDGRFCLNHYLSLGQSNNMHAPLMKLNELSEKIGFKHHGIAIWTDTTLTKRMAWGSWLSASAPYLNSPYEGILVLYKNQWKKEKKGKSTITPQEFMMATSGVWSIKTEHNGFTKANFPIDLPFLCIKLLSYEGELILDPFNGSGSTSLAAKYLNRNFIGIEISEKYCKIAEDRLRQETLFSQIPPIPSSQIV